MADVAVPLRETPARRLPAVLARVRWPLVAIVVLGAVWTAWFTLQCVQYFIQPDELEYVKQSRRIAEQLHPLLPGDRYFNSWSQLQPTLLAPVWAIADTNLAHQVMGIVNAIIMASAAIPAYLLTRRVVAARWAAYLVALLTVAIPWMAAAATMMTEVAAYPAFLWGALAVQHAIARPSPRADLIGMAGVALAFSARPQLAVLAGTLVGGVLWQELRFAADDGDRLAPRRVRLGRALRTAAGRHRVLLGVAAVALLAYAAVRPDVFGGYSDSGVTTGVLSAPGLLDFSRETLAYVTAGIAVVPLAMAAGWALGTLWRPLGREQHAFAVVLVLSVAALTIVVGSFTARYTPQGINSRYLFYVAPLLLIGMVLLALERRPLALPLALGGLLAGWVVYGAKLAQAGPSLVSPDQTFHTVLIGRTYQVGKALGVPHLSVPHLLGVVGIAAVLVLALLRRGAYGRVASVAAVAAVTLFCVAETGYSLKKIADTQAGVDQAFIDGRHWVDDALPDGQRAQMIVSTLGDPASSYGVWWDVAYWNSSVDRAMTLPTTPDLQQPFPETFRILPNGQFYGFAGDSKGDVGPGLGQGPWFVRAASDMTFRFRDEQVVAERFGVQLVKTPSPPTAAWSLVGTYDDTGRIPRGMPAPSFLIAFPRDPAAGQRIRVKIVLGTLPGGELGQRYRAGRKRGFVAAGKTAEVTLRLPVDPKLGYAAVPLRAPGKLDPAKPRGLQVLSVETP